MSEENVEIAKRFIDAYGAGEGIERAFSVFPPDVVIYPFPEWVEKSEYRGHDGVRELTAVWRNSFDDFAIVLEEARDLGDRVMILGETTGRIKGSGVPIRQPVGAVFSDFRAGKIGQARFFMTKHQTIEAAGLRE